MRKHISGGLTAVAAVILILLTAFSRTEEAIVSANVSLLRQNVFYIGVDNPIEINVTGVAQTEITPLISGGSIMADSIPGRYIVRVKEGNKATINLSIIKDGKREIISNSQYRIKRVPDPVTYINDIHDQGIILKERIPNITGVFTRMVNFDFVIGFKPQSFSMSVHNDSTWVEYKATGPELTSEMKDALMQLNPGHKILFHDVVAVSNSGETRKTNPVIITVK